MNLFVALKRRVSLSECSCQTQEGYHDARSPPTGLFSSLWGHVAKEAGLADEEENASECCWAAGMQVGR